MEQRLVQYMWGLERSQDSGLRRRAHQTA